METLAIFRNGQDVILDYENISMVYIYYFPGTVKDRVSYLGSAAFSEQIVTRKWVKRMKSPGEAKSKNCVSLIIRQGVSVVLGSTAGWQCLRSSSIAPRSVWSLLKHMCHPLQYDD